MAIDLPVNVRNAAIAFRRGIVSRSTERCTSSSSSRPVHGDTSDGVVGKHGLRYVLHRHLGKSSGGAHVYTIERGREVGQSAMLLRQVAFIILQGINLLPR